MNNDFYVYLHKRASDGKVFYVGKGRARRAWSKIDRNRYWKNTEQKHGLLVDIIFDGLTESEAFEEEKNVIAELKYFGEPLTNMTDGGEGISGFKQSEESKRINSEKAKARMKLKKYRDLAANGAVNQWADPEKRRLLIEKTKARMQAKKYRDMVSRTHKGKKLSDSHISAIRDFWTGKPKSKKHLDALRASNFRRIKCDNGMTFDAIIHAIEWLKSQGFEKAAVTSISAACKGNQKSAYGYKWEYLEER